MFIKKIRNYIHSTIDGAKLSDYEKLPEFIYDPETEESVSANRWDCSHSRWRIPDLQNGGYKKDDRFSDTSYNGNSLLETGYLYVNTNWVPHPEETGYVSVWSIDHPVVNRWKDLRRKNLDIEFYEKSILEADAEKHRLTSPAFKKLKDKKGLLTMLYSERSRVSAIKELSFLLPLLEEKIEQEEKNRDSLSFAFESAYNDAEEKFLKRKRLMNILMKAAIKP
tara:strand:+ start:1539 stop:2207 length:669 start_codon:yes stop_codon:yes gene_type:complete